MSPVNPNDVAGRSNSVHAIMPNGDKEPVQLVFMKDGTVQWESIFPGGDRTKTLPPVCICQSPTTNPDPRCRVHGTTHSLAVIYDEAAPPCICKVKGVADLACKVHGIGGTREGMDGQL